MEKKVECWFFVDNLMASMEQKSVEYIRKIKKKKAWEGGTRRQRRERETQNENLEVISKSMKATR